MQQSRSHIIIASSLALLFTVFNVGLPVAMYVCPMMGGDHLACTCNCTPEGLSISLHRDACCNPRVLSERNTTPFLDVAKFKTPETEPILVLSNSTFNLQSPSAALASVCAVDTGPVLPSSPLYLQSSPLLI